MRKLLLCALLLLPIQVLAETSHSCLTKTIYWEARGESLIGQYAIANVVMNRLRSKVFPNTVCGVIYQTKQFSWTFIHKYDKVKDQLAWRIASTIAKAALEGIVPDVTNKATHYHAVYVKPKWGNISAASRHIGKHIFYNLS